MYIWEIKQKLNLMTPEQIQQQLQMAFQGITNRANQAKAAGEELVNISNFLSSMPMPPDENLEIDIRAQIAVLKSEAEALILGAEDVLDSGERMQELFNENF